MASLITSHASIGDSTLKDARDLTNSSLGGPEDFTLNLIDHLRRNKPNFKHRDQEQLTTSSLGGPEDFTADIVKHAGRSKSDDSLQRSKGRVVTPLRQTSYVSVTTTRQSPSLSSPHSQPHSPDCEEPGRPAAAATKSNDEIQSRRPSCLSKPPPQQKHVEARSLKKPVNGANHDIALDENGNMSIIVKGGNVYHKKVRSGVRQKMQPSVSDDDNDDDDNDDEEEEEEEEEEKDEEDSDKDESTESLPLSPQNHHPPELTMSLPLPLLEDDFTKPLGESTPTQQTLNLSPSSKNSTLENGFDFATSLAHRIQRTPASAKNPEADEYSINLSADASALLADGMYRPETFPHNNSFVRNCSDANVAFADRIRGIRPDTTSTGEHAPEAEPELSKGNETDLLRQQLEEMKAALAQKDEAIAALQTKLSAKEVECTQLQDVLRNKSSNLATAETRETALQAAVRAAEAETAAAAKTAAERFAIVKDALIAAEDEAVVAGERARDALGAAEARADAAVSRCRRLEEDVRKLTASERAATVEAKRARKEQAAREALWVERSEVLLAECDRRGKALMVKIGELELPGVRDESGKQAYRYQKGREWGTVDVVR